MWGFIARRSRARGWFEALFILVLNSPPIKSCLQLETICFHLQYAGFACLFRAYSYTSVSIGWNYWRIFHSFSTSFELRVSVDSSKKTERIAWPSGPEAKTQPGQSERQHEPHWERLFWMAACFLEAVLLFFFVHAVIVCVCVCCVCFECPISEQPTQR